LEVPQDFSVVSSSSSKPEVPGAAALHCAAGSVLRAPAGCAVGLRAVPWACWYAARSAFPPG